ncbi:cytochrome P450 [Nonomuraea jabiensis]|uniref:Cytochrome P450 n=1 Tax=Nonomuraea jabiensis TaxID=882448 RepID=A0A7W9G4G5_9ACTN|nr:cytochrome P450 [Nonomuraea jabiensis]
MLPERRQGVPAVSVEDVELGGHTIEAGTTVLLSLNIANRDPERFTDLHVLDLRRQERGHLAFSHGSHQCLGQQLARVELRVTFPALLGRFPTLRLAVPANEVVLRPEAPDIYGVKSLPVTWTRDRTSFMESVPSLLGVSGHLLTVAAR